MLNIVWYVGDKTFRVGLRMGVRGYPPSAWTDKTEDKNNIFKQQNSVLAFSLFSFVFLLQSSP